MPPKHTTVTELREDVSRFVVHLTRDDRKDFTGGGKAKANFLAILNEKKILAARPHCLHHAKVKDTPQEKSFNVACFTEVPLNQIQFLVGPIAGRRIELESYGFVFTK